jgi:hypothetical protein
MTWGTDVQPTARQLSNRNSATRSRARQKQRYEGAVAALAIVRRHKRVLLLACQQAIAAGAMTVDDADALMDVVWVDAPLGHRLAARDMCGAAEERGPPSFFET